MDNLGWYSFFSFYILSLSIDSRNDCQKNIFISIYSGNLQLLLSTSVFFLAFNIRKLKVWFPRKEKALVLYTPNSFLHNFVFFFRQSFTWLSISFQNILIRNLYRLRFLVFIFYKCSPGLYFYLKFLITKCSLLKLSEGMWLDCFSTKGIFYYSRSGK